MDMLQALWDADLGQQRVFDLLRTEQAARGISDQALFVIILALCHSIPMYGLNLLYTVFTRLAPATSERFRYLPGKRAKPDLVHKCIIYVTVFHLVVAPLGAWFGFPFAQSRIPDLFDAPVPGAGQILASLVLNVLSTDFFFYWGHRMLHTSFFYKRVHKQHHDFHVTIGFAAEYAHPFEMLVGNVWPVLSALILFRMHFVVWALWIFIAMTSTVSAHSGLWYPSLHAGFHDWHHSANIGNYGATPFWDELCKTDRGWKQQQQKLRGGGQSK